MRHGHIYLAQPPLYRLTQGAKSVYAMDDADREAKTQARVQGGGEGRGQPVQGPGRDAAGAAEGDHDGPGEADAAEGGGARRKSGRQTNELVESLMGRRPELRFAFIQERARTVEEVDV